MALCFVFSGNFEASAQKRAAVKKPVKRKLVKCRVNGKVVYRTKCPTIPIPSIKASTTGNRSTTQTPDEPYGLMSGESQGNGGGLGAGRGTGQGSGIGNEYGDTEQQTTVNPRSRVKPKGPTQNLTIISKPRAMYTDAARQNQVQGTVTLKVQFLANGLIGTISPVSGLGYGLTEQAMAAARGIRFEPARRNGVAYTTVKTVSYSFTIY